MAAGGKDELQAQFDHFAKFGNTKSDGTAITLANVDKWMKQAKVIDGKKITTTDTGISFSKQKSRTLNFAQFMNFVDDLANTKHVDSTELKLKLKACGAPGTTNTTSAVKAGGVDRLTDAARYTGTHKERFDESGKGKGVAGREDVTDDGGYVGGYKNADTYDKTH